MVDRRAGRSERRDHDDCATSCLFFGDKQNDVIKIGAKRRHPVDASERTGERRVKSRDGLSMAKRGLSSSENQTKSAKKKKAEDAEVDAAPGSRVYTVEYQVDTTIDEFDEDVMDDHAGYQGGYHED